MGRPPSTIESSIADDRILTSCAVVCARMDGWWTLATGNPVTTAFSESDELADGIVALTSRPVLMERTRKHDEQIGTTDRDRSPGSAPGDQQTPRARLPADRAPTCR